MCVGLNLNRSELLHSTTMFSWFLINCILIVSRVGCYQQQENGTVKRPNILFILLDDFRPTINALGDQKAITPHMDRIVEKSYIFQNTFAQVSFFIHFPATFFYHGY